jgi:8-amino-7-oxononanoate synthase
MIQSAAGPCTRIDGREYLYFVGTGYLGLQAHSEVIRAACEATERYGIHSATTRAGFGDTPPVVDAECRSAEFFGAQAAFYFASGYAGNSILLRAIEERFDVLLADELSHYSVFDAAQQTARPLCRFRHRDVEDLARQLRTNVGPSQRPLVMTDGVFSVRGTIAPLGEYRSLLGGYRCAGLLVDDAHGVGVLGASGRGTWEHAELFDAGLNGNGGGFLCATMSKALGGFGGVIPGSSEFIARVKAASHWYDGASAPMVAAAAASAKAIEIIQTAPDLRTRLRTNVRQLKDGLRSVGLDVDDTPVPIVCLVLGNGDNMRRIQGELMRQGIAIAYLPAYSGLGEGGGLRIAVFANHTSAMIEQLLDRLRRLI